jgi:hypothetical protein
MPLQRAFLDSVAGLFHSRGSGLIRITSEGVHRLVHVTGGQLISADSNVAEERLGDLLVAQGRLDPALIEPIAAEAKRQGRLVGEQLVADGLLSLSELLAVLDRQALLRFERAIRMVGVVSVDPPMTGTANILRRSLASATVDAFRTTLFIGDIEAFIEAREPHGAISPLRPGCLDELGLTATETRAYRRLAAGEPWRHVAKSMASVELGTRLVGALVALRIWS